MSNVLILGAGGHARFIADILMLQGHTVIGYLDDDLSIHGQMQLGLPVLGSIDTYQDFFPEGLIVGIGSNAIRRSIAERFDESARSLWVNAVHPRATIAPSVKIGCGVVIGASAVISPEAVIGDHSIISTAATVGHDSVIGPYTHIGPGAHLAGGVQVLKETFLGIGSSVIPGRKIGAKTVVGAGAVVVSDIPAGVIAKGVPARW